MHLFYSNGASLLIFFQAVGLFNLNLNSKNHNFPENFPVFFWYTYSYYVALLNDNTKQFYNRVRSMLIIYDHKAEHLISDVPKHSMMRSRIVVK